MQTAPQLLRAWRGSRPQSECAKILGSSQPSYCNWEKGNVSPNKKRRASIEAITEGAVPASSWPAHAPKAPEVAPAAVESDAPATEEQAAP